MSTTRPRSAILGWIVGLPSLLLGLSLLHVVRVPQELGTAPDLVYLSQGLGLLSAGVGYLGLLAAFLLGLHGRRIAALLAVVPALTLCLWNLLIMAPSASAVSPSREHYQLLAVGLACFAALLALVELANGRAPRALRLGLRILGGVTLAAWLGGLFYLLRLYV
ncbi:hypothetical protein D3C76_857250 [compost metagenome]